MHEECLFIHVRYNTAISPVHVIPTLQTCRIVYYIGFYINLNPLLYVFDLINELLIIVDAAIWRNLRPVFPGSESYVTLQSGKMEYYRVK